MTESKAETPNLLLNGLTQKQQEAVRMWDADLEIIASAGSGKTKTITHRILNMIANGVEPENIVAITFTKKAAAEMKARIYKLGRELLGSTKGFAAMFIGTIDSWCFKSLQDLKTEYTKYSVLDDIQTRIFLERYEKENGFENSMIDRAYNLNFFYGEPCERYDRKLELYSNLMSILNNTWYNRKYRRKWGKDILGLLDKYNKCLQDNR